MSVPKSFVRSVGELHPMYFVCEPWTSIFDIHAVRTADTENNHTADSQIRFLFTFLSLINDADSAGTILLKMYRHEYRNFAHVF